MYSPHISSDRPTFDPRNLMENKIGNSVQSEGIQKMSLISSKSATFNISMPKLEIPNIGRFGHDGFIYSDKISKL